MHLFLTFFLAFALPQQEECRRIENRIVVKDYKGASDEAKKLVEAYPDSLAVQEVAVKAFSLEGREKEALEAFHRWQALSNEPPPRHLYEDLAWGVIAKGEKSDSPMIRLIATLAAFRGQDAKGVRLIERRLSDSNAVVRLAAAEVASQLPDNSLQVKVKERLEKETDWEIKLLLIQAVGRMKMKAMKPFLMKLIADPKSTLEERMAATESLFSLMETIPQGELQELASADRAVLRALAAQALVALQDKDSSSIVWKLIDDPNPVVRGQALLALGVLRLPADERVFKRLNDPEFHVAIAAAYATILSGSSRADPWVEDFIQHNDPEKRRLVASLLGALGDYGKPLARKLWPKTDDFYVKMNLALAIQDPEALDFLYEGIVQNNEKWSRGKNGVFRPLEPSTAPHRPGIPNWPESVNQETRLELLNLLAVKEHPRALVGVRTFLKKSGWGISGLSSLLLLTEGDELAPDQVRELLKDEDADIRLQAAIILSRWSSEEAVADILKTEYNRLPREKKEIVLEAMGAIGDQDSLDFLVKELGSPYATLRLIAAASLLKSLYD